MKRLLLGSLDDIADGQAKGFDPDNTGNDTLFIVRKGRELFAYRDICPHYNDTSLPWKQHQYLDGAGNYIVCAAHGALFNIDNGECVQGPCLGQGLDKIPVQISAENEIFIESTIIKEFKL
ncbi:Rieske 2Fe-2S domain-containing protein [Shewanella sp. UCD-KL21]|uniref:Rieske (2Fe-2S) protein n=1 Tax=Shewanella sp. UCD-KL21 TaxID=1917164 RepID=UPI0009708816|nr:Rieske 2Fe-2S domain-containing protein [Shewanella sp. UCD-KL21]